MTKVVAMTPPLSLRNKLVRLLVAAAVLGVIAYFAFPFVGSYTKLGEKVKQVGAARLQAWAVSVLDHPPAMPMMTGVTGADPVPIQNIPDDLKPLTNDAAVSYQPRVARDGIEDCVRFDYGAGGSHYSLVVGRADFHPKMQEDFLFEQVADGVWIIHPR